MSHQQPQPGQFPQQPGPVEEPKPKKKTGRKIVFGSVGALVLIFVVAGIAGGGEESTEPAAEAPPAVEPAEEESAEEVEAEPAEEPAEEVEEEPAEEEETVPESQPVTVEATATEFQPSIAYDGGEFTSVEVTIVNDSDGNIEVNPLYFSLVASDGSKVNAVLGEDDRQIDTLTLSPGQQVNGVLTGEGAFTVASVEFAPDLFGGDTFVGQVGQ